LPLANGLFFFSSLTPKLVRATRDYLYSNGTVPGTLRQSQTITQIFNKVTYLTDRVRANGSLLATPLRDTGRLRGYRGTGTNFAVETKASSDPLNTQGFDMDKYSANFNVDIVLNRGSFVTFRGAYFYDNYNDNGFLLTTPYIYSRSSVGDPNVPPELQGPVGTVNVPAVQISQKDKTQRSSIDADYNLFFRALGRHVLRAGAGMERMAYDVDQSYPGGLVQIFWNNPPFTSPVTGQTDIGTYGLTRTRSRLRARGRSHRARRGREAVSPPPPDRPGGRNRAGSATRAAPARDRRP
jgi:hypothetical protein